MDAAIFTDANFPDCGCCACSPGVLEFSAKGDTYARAGYAQFTGAAKLFRTVVSRGWGYFGDVPFANTPVFNDVQCSHGRAFAIAGDSLLFGSCLSRVWLTAYPFDPETTPDVESTACADGFNDFASPAPSAAYHQTYAIGPEYPQFGPRGESRLLGEITADEAFAEARAYVESLEWPAEEEGTGISVALLTGASAVTCQRKRYRRRFPVPAHGGLRLEWDLYFQPAGVTGYSFYDTLSWQWDREVPEGYDPEDSATWPVTPWFELPEFTGDYGTFLIEAADWRAKCGPDLPPEAPGAISGYAA